MHHHCSSKDELLVEMLRKMASADILRLRETMDTGGSSASSPGCSCRPSRQLVALGRAEGEG